MMSRHATGPLHCTGPESGPRRLLILDDDPDIASTIGEIARSVGFETRSARSAREFSLILVAWQPTHVTLDLVMPGTDGVEVIAELAKQRLRARLIVVSGIGGRVLEAAGRYAAEHGLELGGTLGKPFPPAALRRVLLSADCGRPTQSSSRSHPASGAGDFEVSEEALRCAIDSRCLTVTYDPVIRSASGEMTGVRASPCWRDASGRVVRPAAVARAARSSGLSDRMTDVVLDEALRWFSPRYPDSGSRERPVDRDITLSLDVPEDLFRDLGAVSRIEARCGQYLVAPSRIVFALSAAEAVLDPLMVLGFAARMRTKGFALALSQVGFGFAWTRRLADLPLSEIRIDAAEMAEMGVTPETRAFVRTTANLAKRLGWRCCADGIGDAETLHWVTDAGCAFAAGGYVSGALAARDQAPPSARRQPIDTRAVRGWNWLTLVRSSPAPPGSEERRS